MAGPRTGSPGPRSPSRPLLAKGVTSSANLLTPLTSLFSDVPTATAAPVRATSCNG